MQASTSMTEKEVMVDKVVMFMHLIQQRMVEHMGFMKVPIVNSQQN